MPEKYTNPTVGSMFFAKSIMVDGKQHNLQIWDTAGQERFKAMTPLCFKDADGVIMVCDLTDKSTLMGLREWHRTIEDNAPEEVGICIVGNKMDMEDQVQVTENELKEFSEFIKCPYVMTSAWQNKGIEVRSSLNRMPSGISRSR